MRKRNSFEDVWRYIDVKGDDECWPWTSNRLKFGHGTFTVNFKTYKAHRIVYVLSNPGKATMSLTSFNKDSLIVMHSCDNPWCCNPKHLKLGTPMENMKDMRSKGREKYCGYKNRKLSKDDVERIKEALLFGANQYDLASVYGVSQGTISNVNLRKFYGDI